MKSFLSLSVLFLTAFSLYAQTAAEMDELLETQALTYSQAARFVLPAADALADGVPEDAAFTAAADKGWLPKTVSAGDTARLDTVAFLLMKAFDLRGGLFYRLFPTARYAYRELRYKQIIQGPVDSSMSLSGEQFFQVLGRTMDMAEKTAAKNGEGQQNE